MPPAAFSPPRWLRMAAALALVLPAWAAGWGPSRLARSFSRQAFVIARPNYPWRFPRDAGAHPEYQNEWWYFTGNLRSAAGHRFGFELTFFRISPWPGATLAQDLFFAHFAVSDITGRHFTFHARARRGAWGQAGVTGSPPLIWNVNWRAQFGPNGPRALRARWGRFAIHLRLHPCRRMFNGPDGYSRKGPGPGEASEYYSIPRIAAAGSLMTGGRHYAVTGLVWMDHEFATDQLAANQIGWNWIGVQFTSDPKPSRQALRDLMLFQLRDQGGARDPFSAGTLRTAAGVDWRGPQRGCAARPAYAPSGLGTPYAPARPARPPRDATLTAAQFHMTPGRIWRSPKTGRRYPVVWRVEIPSCQLRLTVTADLDDQELRARVPIAVNYWEGAVRVRGYWRDHPIQGQGYLEMTGYSHPLTAFHAPAAGRQDR